MASSVGGITTLVHCAAHPLEGPTGAFTDGSTWMLKRGRSAASGCSLSGSGGAGAPQRVSSNANPTAPSTRTTPPRRIGPPPRPPTSA
ncbi:hypothetical protein [Corallococcus exercitus]|uniref:hypothetical protein n=1 Tax=Corallococcus exercitus TaxID=2316736 RepID=UPI001ABFA6E8|nr:hypothetical protein [Corallococcus exercitus]